MFQPAPVSSNSQSFWALVDVIYHTIVRKVREGHRNAVVGIALDIMRSLVMVVAFLFMFLVLGLRSSPIRGDFLLFIMTGIFMYITHIKAVGAVAGSEGPTSAMMKHAPMNTFIAIIAAALASLYKQIFALGTILLVYHIAFVPITIHAPANALCMMILAWFSGVAVGTVFLALSPWIPELAGLLRTFYIRLNMIASGKMFVVNMLPASMIALFDWNPLFHIIDQMRGFVFLHYNPYLTSIMYPVYVSLALLMIGMLGEFFTRRSASLSWTAGR
ncbi:MAG: ABC transporter permease [Pseudomonadota bacterium]